jgi:large subunit ribosomal protein L1
MGALTFFKAFVPINIFFMKKYGKKYREIKNKIVKEFYSVDDAVKLLPETSTAKFDATIELHANLNLDPKKPDQQIRTTLVLPHGTGKTKRIVAFVNDEDIASSKKAGAIEAGGETLIEKIKGGFIDFDIAVAHPDLMKNVAKIGKILGTKGLMPSPKAGTVSANPVDAITEIMKGRVELRLDPKGIVHIPCGKVSFDVVKIKENIKAVLEIIKSNKPSGVKGTYILSIALTTTMGPSIMLDMSEVRS